MTTDCETVAVSGACAPPSQTQYVPSCTPAVSPPVPQVNSSQNDEPKFVDVLSQNGFVYGSALLSVASKPGSCNSCSGSQVPPPSVTVRSAVASVAFVPTFACSAPAAIV